MLHIKAGTFIYIHLTVSIARMLAASMQCWTSQTASRACLHRKNGFAVNQVKGSSLNDGVTGRQPIRRFYGVMEEL